MYVQYVSAIFNSCQPPFRWHWCSIFILVSVQQPRAPPPGAQPYNCGRSCLLCRCFWKEQSPCRSRDGDVAKMAAKQAKKSCDPLGEIRSIGAIKGEFKDPAKDRKFTSMAISKDGYVFAADGLNRVIVVFQTDGKYVRQFKVDDVGISIGGMAVTTDGFLVITNFQNHRVSIYTDTGDKKTDFKPEGDMKGPGGVAINEVGHIFISECQGNAISVFNSEGEFMYKFGTKGSNPGQFNWPLLMCFGPDELLYVSDHQNNRVQVFSQSGDHVRVFGKDCVKRPIGVCPTAEGYIVVVSRDPHKVCFFTTNGHLVHEIKDAGLNFPYGLAISCNDDIFIADTNNCRVLKF